MKNLSTKEALVHASEEDASPSDLHELAQHPGALVKMKVAGHGNTAEHTLQHLHDNAHLAGTDEHRLKKIVAGNNNAPSHLVNDKIKSYANENQSDYYDLTDAVDHPKAYPDIANKTMHSLIEKHGQDENGQKQNLPNSLSYAASRWLKGPHSTHEDASKYLAHHDEDMVDAAINSKKLKEGDLSNHLANQKKLDFDKTKDIIDDYKNLSPDFLKSVHDRAETQHKSSKDDNYQGEYRFNNLKEAIFEHPNVSKDLLEKEIESGEKDSGYSHYSNLGARAKALKHPSIDAAVVDSKARQDDNDAIRAALSRQDTQPSLLEHLWGKVGKANKKNSSYTDRNIKGDVIAHPNFPEALAKKEASKDTDLARSLLKKKNLSPDTLKEIVMHKNQDVAIEALKHPNVDESVVEHAFKRKAADVSRAAADHELATPEMKMQKVEADPEAAAMIATDADPQMAKAIFDKHGHHYGVAQNLLKNGNVTPEIIKGLLKHAQDKKYSNVKNDRGYSRDNTDDIINTAAKNSNLDSDLRRHLLKINPDYTVYNENIHPDEMAEALNFHKNGTHEDAARNMKILASGLLNHNNMTTDLAKKIVTGEFGDVRNDKVDLTKPHFTRDVVKAGLEASPELVDHNLTKNLAGSTELNSQDIDQYLNQSFDHRNNSERNFHLKRAEGLVSNVNASRDALKKAIHGELKASAHDTEYIPIARAALGNPSLHRDDLKNLYQNFDTFDRAVKINRSDAFSRELVDSIRGHGLEDDALKTAHGSVVDKLIHRNEWSNEIDKDKFAKALNHPVKSVVSDLISKHGGKFKGENDKTKAELFDQFASDPNSELAKTAYPYMSKAGQEKILSSSDLNDPFIIKNASEDKIKDFKINKDTNPDVLTAIVGHKGATLDHLHSAVDHSPEGAADVLDRLGFSDKKGARDAFSDADRSALHQKILDNHSDDERLPRAVLKQTTDPNTVQKAIQNPNSLNYVQSIIENKSVKSGDLDHFKNFTNPESSGGMYALAKSGKASVGLLGHIAQHYPEHLPEVAANPKAGSAKLLKTLIDKGDLETHAALAKNDKVPDEVRAHLMKNPKVLMAADPEKATPEMLDKLSKGDDIDLHKFIVDNPNATPEHRATSVKYALQKVKSGSPEDSQKAQRIIDSGLSKKLHESALDEIASQGENHAAKALKNEGATPALALKHLDNYKGSPKILDSLADSRASDHPAVMDKMLDYADFSHEGKDDFYAPARMRKLLNANEDSLKDSHVEKFYNKLKEARPEGYQYQNNHIKESDANSIKWVAGNSAKPEIQKELSNHPELLSHLAENSRLNKENYDNLVHKYTNADDNFKKMSSYDDMLGALANHPQAHAESLDKLYNHMAATKKEPDYNEIRNFAASKRISPTTAEKILDNHPGVTEILRNPALPHDRLKHVVEQQFGHADNLPDNMKNRRPKDMMSIIASNPKFRLSMLNDIPKDKLNEADAQDRLTTAHQFLLQNPHADSEDLRKAFESLAPRNKEGFHDAGYRKNLQDYMSSLIDNPKAPEDLIRELVENPNAKKEDFYHSPVIGGDLWREQEHKFPEGLGGLDQGKEINQAFFRPREEKIKQVQSMIPDGGKLVWADFKKQNPSLAGDPLVQKMFTSAPKQMVDQGHAQKYLDDMPKKEFHVSYVPWNGMQRHNGKTQAVFQINNGPDQDAAYKSDQNLMGLYKMIQKASFRSGHPVNPQAIGWSRVDTSNPNHWFIDEVQSDYNSGLSRELDQIQKTGRSDELEKHGIESSKSKQTLNKMVDIIQGWEKALVNNIIETAKKHGVKKVSMHSGESKTLVNKGQKAEVTNKYDKLYNKMPQEMGFKPDVYDNVASRSSKSELMGNPVWTLDFNPEESQDLKNKRREKLEGKMAMKKDKEPGEGDQ